MVGPLRDGRRRACSLSLLTLVTLGFSFLSTASAASCWTEGFTAQDCCEPEYGPTGNEECWDEVYTYESCCQGGSSSPDLGCRSEYFSQLQNFTLEFYSSGRAPVQFFQLYPRMLTSFNSRFELCAPAVLQALLLSLEEKVPTTSPDETADQLAVFSVRMLQAQRLGRLPSAGGLDEWPLDEGLERVRNLLQGMGRRAGSGLASGLGVRPKFVRRPSIHMVMTYCREELDWMNVTFTRSLLRHIDLVFVMKCQGGDPLDVVPHRHMWRSVESIVVEDESIRGDECSGYFGYLTEKYDDFPDHAVFVHADAPEHIGSISRPNILDDTLRALVNGLQIPFAHLGGNRVTMRWDNGPMAALWKGLFGSSITPIQGDVAAYCCSHLVVSKERVWQRPLRFYENALELMTSPDAYSHLLPGVKHVTPLDVEGRAICQHMMFLWHIIFGEDLYLPHRMFQPSLPLFLKTRNVRMAYFHLDPENPEVKPKL